MKSELQHAKELFRMRDINQQTCLADLEKSKVHACLLKVLGTCMIAQAITKKLPPQKSLASELVGVRKWWSDQAEPIPPALEVLIKKSM